MLENQALNIDGENVTLWCPHLTHFLITVVLASEHFNFIIIKTRENKMSVGH